jgi:hypothetical protein
VDGWVYVCMHVWVYVHACLHVRVCVPLFFFCPFQRLKKGRVSVPSVIGSLGHPHSCMLGNKIIRTMKFIKGTTITVFGA